MAQTTDWGGAIKSFVQVALPVGAVVVSIGTVINQQSTQIALLKDNLQAQETRITRIETLVERNNEQIIRLVERQAYEENRPR